MSCYITDERILLGITNKKAIVTVCKNCSAYSVPHFNYINKKYEVTLSLLSPTFVDSFENIKLSDRTDLEEFLNTIISIEDLQRNEYYTKKLNKQFFRQQRKNKKNTISIATLYVGDKYFSIDQRDIEEDMTYWDLVVKLWNKYNKQKTPKNLYKPYYRNFIEYIDRATFSNVKDREEYLEGATCYIKSAQERTPHFCYRLNTGEEFAILFERSEYMKPIPRKLTQKELNNLISFLNAKNKLGENNWQRGCRLWNEQNFDYNENSPSWFPKYKKMNENIKMPNYAKLNDEEM